MNGERGGRSAGVGGSGGEEGTERRPARRLGSLEGWGEAGRGRAKNWRRASEGPDGRPKGPAGPGRPAGGHRKSSFVDHCFIVFSLTFCLHFL